MKAAAMAALAATLVACAASPTREQIAALPAPHLADTGPITGPDGRARYREILCGLLDAAGRGPAPSPGCDEVLWRLADEPPPTGRGLPAPGQLPQVYLVSGAFGECLGEEAIPFNGPAAGLRAAGYRIAAIVPGGRSGSRHNAAQIAARLASAPAEEQGPAIMIGYSKGANDILEFLVDHPVEAARVSAVVSIAGAIGGSPVADGAAGLYDTLLRHLPAPRCAPGDGEVLDSLQVATRRAWLAAHPLPRGVRYYSIAAFATRDQVAALLVPSWKDLAADDPRADGQVLARDQLIPGATLLAYLRADHWAAAIEVEKSHPLLASRRDPRAFPRWAVLEALLLQLAEDASASD